jgi:hypothetical protein
MDRGEATRRYLPVPAISPKTGGSIEVKVSMDQLRRVGKRSKGQAMEAAYIVPEILASPKAIFSGLRDDVDEPGKVGVGSLCYCGIPSLAYTEDARQRQA